MDGQEGTEGVGSFGATHRTRQSKALEIVDVRGLWTSAVLMLNEPSDPFPGPSLLFPNLPRAPFLLSPTYPLTTSTQLHPQEHPHR